LPERNVYDSTLETSEPRTGTARQSGRNSGSAAAGLARGKSREYHPEPLKGRLRGLYKLREGDYRIVYEILRRERVIIVHLIGHRREIYE